MSLPTYNALMLPLLQLAADKQEHAISHLRERLARQQLAIRLPSGRQATFDNRVGFNVPS